MGTSHRIAVGAWCVFAVVVCAAVTAGSASDGSTLPSWLVAGDPVDETIRDYWERADRGELDADSLVDLGTMIFDRGHSDEAIGFYRQALDVDSDMYEAWFRIGLIEHTRGDLDNAEQAYSRCLKKRPGHAWCHFYYGLLEEQLGHTSKAMEHYEEAFKKAPRLADPKFNPEVMSSRLALGARLRQHDMYRFEEGMPMRYLRPSEVNRVRRSYGVEGKEDPIEEPAPEAPEESVTATGAPVPAAKTIPPAEAPAQRPAPAARRVPARSSSTPSTSGTSGNTSGSTGGETPYGAPTNPVANASDEAHLVPTWAGLWRLAEALV